MMMSTQLNVALQREMSYIVSDEKMMERALKSLRQIRRERKLEQAAQQGDSDRLVATSLRRAFKELKQYQEGKLELQSANDFLKELNGV